MFLYTRWVIIYVGSKKRDMKTRNEENRHYCPIEQAVCRWFKNGVTGKICEKLECSVLNFERCPIPSQQKSINQSEENGQ